MSRTNRFAFLFYPCNLVGYLRLCLVGAAVAAWLSPVAGGFGREFALVGLLVAGSVLDALDGHLARRFGHETRFGEILDQITDLLISSVLWLASGFVLAAPVLVLEWLTAVAVLVRRPAPGSHCAPAGSGAAVRFMARFLANRQRNPLSIYANVAHLAFPAAIVLGPGFQAVAYLAAPGVLLFLAATALILVSTWRAGARNDMRISRKD